MNTKKPLIIGIAGKKHSGKTTAASAIKKHLKHEYKNVVIRGFSEPLKTLCNEYLFIDGKYLWGSEDEKNMLLRHLNGAPTARKVLQLVGTDWFRSLNKDIWVVSMISFVEKHNAIKFLIIPDVRFQNEVDWINRSGGFVVFLKRNPLRLDTHLSETELDKIGVTPPNVCIDNSNMTIEQQQDAVIAVVVERIAKQ